MLDELDRRILEILAANARVSLKELAQKAGAPTKRFDNPVIPSDEMMAKVKQLIGEQLLEARKIRSKADRNEAVDELRDRMLTDYFAIPEGLTYTEHVKAEKRLAEAKEAFRRTEKKFTHDLVTKHGVRADGRDYTEIRPITAEVSLFPRTHGSALFQRGETQSICVATLGTARGQSMSWRAGR